MILAETQLHGTMLEARHEGVADGDQTRVFTFYAYYLGGPPATPQRIGSFSLTNLDIDG